MRPPTEGSGRERVRALDAFRGITIAGMLLVNNPGTWSAIYPPLRHAEWHGWTPTDLIFPFFLFIVGITTELSLSARARRGDSAGLLTRRVLIRGGAIVALGLLLHAFPFFPLSRWETLRFPGVLQRIGVCFVAAALLARGRSDRSIVGTTAVLLAGYWLVQALVPPPGAAHASLDDPDGTLSAWIDRSIFGPHLWSASKTWDPEGLLSTVPAIGTCLLGILAGRRLSDPRPMAERLAALFGWGALGMMTGLVWGWFLPINKNLWTGSYVLFTAGMGATVLATMSWLMEGDRFRWASRPLITFGLNPITAFVGSGAMARVLGLVRVPRGGESVPIQRVIFESLFGLWLPPRVASLAYAFTFVLVWYGILLLMQRRGWILRV